MMRPYNKNAVVRDEAQDLFDELTAQLEELSRPLVDKMAFRDLYDFMRDAAITAVGNHVRARANGQTKGPSVRPRMRSGPKERAQFAAALKALQKLRRRK